MREFLGALTTTQGVTLSDRSMPGAIARPLARAMKGTWRALGIRKAPPMTAFAIAMMSRTVTVKTDKARADLGYAPAVSVADGLAAMPRLA